MSDEEHRKLHSTSGNNSVEEEEYTKKYDGYRPRFVGIPEGYFPNTWGIFALNLWLLFLNTVTVPWIYAGIGLGYAIFIITAIFFGQAYRNDLEKKFMSEALEHQAKLDALAHQTHEGETNRM